MEETIFKKQFRLDVCSGCPKRIPCGTMDSICELVTPCSVCEIRDTCTSECSQMKAYLSRVNQGRAGEILTSNINSLENFFSFKNNEFTNTSTIERSKRYTINDIPWGAISERDKTLIVDYFVNGKTLSLLSREHNLTPGRISQLLFGSKGSHKNKKTTMRPKQGALKILREYIRYRDLYTRFSHLLFPSQRKVINSYYFKYKTVKEIANDTNNLPISIYKKLALARKRLKKFSVLI
jgi:hypothetical protein